MLFAIDKIRIQDIFNGEFAFAHLELLGLLRFRRFFIRSTITANHKMLAFSEKTQSNYAQKVNKQNGLFVFESRLKCFDALLLLFVDIVL